MTSEKSGDVCESRKAGRTYIITLVSPDGEQTIPKPVAYKNHQRLLVRPQGAADFGWVPSGICGSAGPGTRLHAGSAPRLPRSPLVPAGKPGQVLSVVTAGPRSTGGHVRRLEAQALVLP